MSVSTAPTEQAREEAAMWFARLKNRNVPATDLEAFRLWRKKPGHKEAYDEVDLLWRHGGRLQDDPDLQASLQQALGRLDRAPARPKRRRRRLVGLALSASVILSMAGAGYALLGPKAYSTAIGEQKVVQLSDGSSVRLDTATRLTVRYSSGRRDLTLEKGQALFDVAHDAARPFVVRAGVTTVTALGTRFDVRREADGARVTLVRGSVEVKRKDAAGPRVWRLAPGQALTTQVRTAAPQPVNLAVATSWSEGRLIFQDVSLSAAIAEVNRYSRDKIVLDAADLAGQPTSGVFETGDTETFVGAVADFHDLTVRRPGNGEIRLTRAQGTDVRR